LDVEEKKLQELEIGKNLCGMAKVRKIWTTISRHCGSLNKNRGCPKRDGPFLYL
jgi:hypothetical protein